VGGLDVREKADLILVLATYDDVDIDTCRWNLRRQYDGISKGKISGDYVFY
jgi:hypothetical protein